MSIIGTPKNTRLWYKAHVRSDLMDQCLSQTVVSRCKLPQHRGRGRIVANNQQVLKRADQLRLLGRDLRGLDTADPSQAGGGVSSSPCACPNQEVDEIAAKLSIATSLDSFRQSFGGVAVAKTACR